MPFMNRRRLNAPLSVSFMLIAAFCCPSISSACEHPLTPLKTRSSDEGLRKRLLKFGNGHEVLVKFNQGKEARGVLGYVGLDDFDVTASGDCRTIAYADVRSVDLTAAGKATKQQEE